MAEHAYTPEVRPGNPQDESCAPGAARKRTRPTLAAFNAMQAERDAMQAQRDEAVNVYRDFEAFGRRMAAEHEAMRKGLSNVSTRIMDCEGGIRALRILADYQTEHAGEDRLEMGRVEHAQDWITRRLVVEIAHAGETAEDALLGRPTTNEGPVLRVKGGAA
ncbi:hypothetical protein EOD42_07565 [Rhodovarius crocodyli]|uniref:Uncharacterized protein n=1 Tax=Rhodovarius crocodyli TaxID=1979269 RepID=A0A437MJ72_9PROT|nr:hypothetical protein [Rhodovarius crocodyli]RVT97666.1 hypothetical protein EOD42_07565 [Rhodovarius crocodyli]